MNAIELAERLDKQAQADSEINKQFGRKGSEWAIESELGYQAARLLREMHAALGDMIDEFGGENPDDDWAAVRRARQAYEAKP